VIEVLTRDATGPQLVIARVLGDSLPTFGITGMARVALSRTLALRLSASGLGGARELPLPMNATLGEGRHAATGSARLEYRAGDRRVVVDGFVDDRHYISPPSDEMSSSILMIDRESTQRISAKGDLKHDKLQLQAQAWAHHLYRRSRFLSDPSLQNVSQIEDLSALRIGGLVLATHPIGKTVRWAASASVDHDSIVVADLGSKTTSDLTIAELAVDGQYEYPHAPVRRGGGARAAVRDRRRRSVARGEVCRAVAPQFGSLEIIATAARKGRVPSLRERFESDAR